MSLAIAGRLGLAFAAGSFDSLDAIAISLDHSLGIIVFAVL